MFKNGAFAYDTWFFLSGLTTTQLFFKSSQELKVTNLKHISSHFEHFFFLVLYKILRLLLPFYVTVQVLRLTMKHMNENSILSVPSNDHFTCDSSTIALLFFNIFNPYNQRVCFSFEFSSIELLFTFYFSS